MMFFPPQDVEPWAAERVWRALDPTALATGVVVRRKSHSSTAAASGAKESAAAAATATETGELRPPAATTPPLELHSLYDLPVGETFSVTPRPADVRAPGASAALLLTRRSYRVVEAVVPAVSSEEQSASVTALLDVQSHEGELLVAWAPATCQLRELQAPAATTMQQMPPRPATPSSEAAVAALQQSAEAPAALCTPQATTAAAAATAATTAASPASTTVVGSVHGTLYVTNYRLAFAPSMRQRSAPQQQQQQKVSRRKSSPLRRRASEEAIEVAAMVSPRGSAGSGKRKGVIGPALLPTMAMSIATAGSLLLGTVTGRARSPIPLKSPPLPNAIAGAPTAAAAAAAAAPTTASAWAQAPQPLWFPLCVLSKVVKSGGQPARKMDIFWGTQERPDDTVVDVALSPYFFAPFFGTIRFAFETPAACVAVHSAISKAYRPLRVADSFAFLYKPPPDEYGPHRCPACLQATDEDAEFLRQGLDVDSPGCMWRKTDVNGDFSLVSTYPRSLVVPRGVSDESLAQVAAFRAKRRIPVLSWWSKHTGATITRGSQPLVGLLSYRSPEDEGLLEAIRLANDPSKQLYILDSRPQTNGVFNRAMGGGYENTTYYAHCSIEFLNMPNIHAVRESFLRLRDTCGAARFAGAQSSYTWMTQIAASGWHDNLRLILAGTERIVSLVGCEETSVFVHCSDSWDRTAQLCSLAELCLDPHYRTMHGFAALIEKEWLRMGHKFRDRLRADSLASAGPGVYEASPVFLQFIECVWQLTRIYPRSFEFSEGFLLAILDEMMLGRFGTFICNNDKERVENAVLAKTPQLWPFLLSLQDSFRNPFFEDPLDLYDELDEDELSSCRPPVVLKPRVEPHLLQFWFNLYRRFFEGTTAATEPSELGSEGMLAQAMHQRLEDLEAEVMRLKADLAASGAAASSYASKAHRCTASPPSAAVAPTAVRHATIAEEAGCGSPAPRQSESPCEQQVVVPRELTAERQQQQQDRHILVAGMQAFTIADYTPLTVSRDFTAPCSIPRDSTGDDEASAEWVRLSHTNSPSSSGASTPHAAKLPDGDY